MEEMPEKGWNHLTIAVGEGLSFFSLPAIQQAPVPNKVSFFILYFAEFVRHCLTN